MNSARWLILVLASMVFLESAHALPEALVKKAKTPLFHKLCNIVLTSQEMTSRVVQQGDSEVVIRGRPFFISPYKLDNEPGTEAALEGEQQLTTLWSDDGVGRWIVIEMLRPYSGSTATLRTILRAFPHYFSRYGLYADDRYLVMADATRLNHLNPKGVQFKDIPYFSRQVYSDDQFIKAAASGYILLASRDDDRIFTPFWHDRMQEHLIGAVFMPSWLFQQALQSAKLEYQLRKNKEIQGNPRLREFVEKQFHFSSQWDRTTQALGIWLSQATGRKGNPRPDQDLITGLIGVLKNNHRAFIIDKRKMMEEAQQNYHGLTTEDLHIYRTVLDKSVLSYQEVSLRDKTYRREAYRLIHDLLGWPVQLIEKVHLNL